MDPSESPTSVLVNKPQLLALQALAKYVRDTQRAKIQEILDRAMDNRVRCETEGRSPEEHAMAVASQAQAEFLSLGLEALEDLLAAAPV